MQKLIALTLLTLSTAASAEFYDGNDLFKNIQGDANARLLALGYVAGVFDLGRGEYHCAPERVTLGQAYDIVKQWMVKKPSVRHMDASVLVSAALMEVWPCEKKSNL
jgi:hypothetical protein